MRALQTVLWIVTIAVLSVIALELHQLTKDFQLGADLRSALASYSKPGPETPEQRKARIRAEAERLDRTTQDTLDEMKAWDDITKERAAHKPAASRR